MQELLAALTAVLPASVLPLSSGLLSLTAALAASTVVSKKLFGRMAGDTKELTNAKKLELFDELSDATKLSLLEELSDDEKLELLEKLNEQQKSVPKENKHRG